MFGGFAVCKTGGSALRGFSEDDRLERSFCSSRRASISLEKIPYQFRLQFRMFQDLRQSKVLVRAGNVIFDSVIFVLHTLEEVRDLPALSDATFQSLKHVARDSKVLVPHYLDQIHQLFYRF